MRVGASSCHLPVGAEAAAREAAQRRARAVAEVVEFCGGNQSEAARLLDLDQSTVNKLVKKVCA